LNQKIGPENWTKKLKYWTKEIVLENLDQESRPTNGPKPWTKTTKTWTKKWDQKLRPRNQDQEIKTKKSRPRNQDQEIKTKKSRPRNQDQRIGPEHLDQ
jgi:hypothetical protein